MSDVSDNDMPPPLPADSRPGELEGLAEGALSPRHRRLAQLAAEGLTNNQICKELGYSVSRVSILLNNPHIAREVSRLQNRVWEEGILPRMKTFSEAALNNIYLILNDRTGRVKVSERMDLSKWVIEMLEGKATQKHTVDGNLLATLIDRLDAKKTDSRDVIESAPQLPAGGPVTEAEIVTEEDPLEAWIRDFNSQA